MLKGLLTVLLLSFPAYPAWSGTLAQKEDIEKEMLENRRINEWVQEREQERKQQDEKIQQDKLEQRSFEDKIQEKRRLDRLEAWKREEKRRIERKIDDDRIRQKQEDARRYNR